MLLLTVSFRMQWPSPWLSGKYVRWCTKFFQTDQRVIRIFAGTKKGAAVNYTWSDGLFSWRKKPDRLSQLGFHLFRPFMLHNGIDQKLQ